ncbi:glyoxalase [Enterococcus sp. JM4C]|uniref:VOC family protein n=1 Tax=Candidatus Enterococcus huntleyi TaxID=1857217 RepID=UPI00137B344B|nr:VOC family protein [Enterococcus sp. JM4C]KAF1295644.1 glyoxalase [Enterococcus sp. JM4C]
MTVIIPEFKIHEKTHPGTVSLKVNDLQKEVTFYIHNIGLQLISETATSAVLGVDGRALVALREIKNGQVSPRKTGLYHMAFLLPERKDLGNVLYHLLSVKAPITGAADHGYSEAIYLNDPEGNGIEIYHDKPRENWDIRSDGEIVGVTLEMDADGVLAAADRKTNQLPAGTVMGHVHLKVAELNQTEKFYTDVLGISLKNNFGGQAKFFAAGDYHHHIGANVWQSKNGAAINETDLGLESLTLLIPDKQNFVDVKEHIQQTQEFLAEDEQSFTVKDPNGLVFIFKME